MIFKSMHDLIAEHAKFEYPLFAFGVRDKQAYAVSQIATQRHMRFFAEQIFKNEFDMNVVVTSMGGESPLRWERASVQTSEIIVTINDARPMGAPPLAVSEPIYVDQEGNPCLKARFWRYEKGQNNTTVALVTLENGPTMYVAASTIRKRGEDVV